MKIQINSMNLLSFQTTYHFVKCWQIHTTITSQIQVSNWAFCVIINFRSHLFFSQIIWTCKNWGIIWKFYKVVSDLETCIDYFALPGRSCEYLNFCFPAQTAQLSELRSQCMFFKRLLVFSHLGKWTWEFKFSQSLRGSWK